MAECLFCRVAAGELPSQKVFESEDVLAFRDIHPVAPVHVLVIPKRHLSGIADATTQDQDLLGRLLDVARRVAQTEGLDNGYRLVVNQGGDGGQSVDHLHVHVLGGRRLEWPPG